MMNIEKKDFDKEAASWDENPARVKLSKDIAHAIADAIVLTPDMDVMDFGCGTGLVTIELAPLVRSITGVDSSPGMLDVLNRKIAGLTPGKIKTLRVDLDKGDTLSGNYDLVLSNMTLHHIKEIKPLFAQFHQVLNPGGHLCIADLDSEHGHFHGDNTGVFHFGFDRQVLGGIFLDAGFDDIRDKSAAEVMKPDAHGEMKRFTVFLMTGRKKTDR